MKEIKGLWVYDVFTPFDIQNNTVTTEIDGEWVPARPTRYPSVLNRLKLAWLILRGEIDGVRWYKQ